MNVSVCYVWVDVGIDREWYRETGCVDRGAVCDTVILRATLVGYLYGKFRIFRFSNPFRIHAMMVVTNFHSFVSS